MENNENSKVKKSKKQLTDKTEEKNNEIISESDNAPTHPEDVTKTNLPEESIDHPSDQKDEPLETTQNSKLLTLPLLAIRNTVIFPNEQGVKIDVGRDKSIKSCELAIKDYNGRLICLSQKNAHIDNPKEEDFFEIGILCNIKMDNKTGSHSLTVRANGIQRFIVKRIIEAEEVNFVEGEVVESIVGNHDEEIALMRRIKHDLESVLQNMPAVPRKILDDFERGVEPSDIADFLGASAAFTFEKKQELLSTLSINERLNIIITEFEKEKEISNIEQNISKKIKDKIDESQKEYYLREKLKAIKEELGDIPTKEDDISTIIRKVKENPYPENIRDKILEEAGRLDMMPPASSEYNIIRTYIDWLKDLPWWQKSEDNIDLNKAQEVLDKHHYGLEKVKERIIEYLAVKQKVAKMEGQIICFVGAPGVGKTSLGKSIAEAVGREFVRSALGGVKDESEIRGHRRTYIGAMPGRIIQSMKKAKTINPVFLLDEIDKLANDYRGDPASALLEVLDPEQNKFFSDNYLEEPYDLSNVMFIATANYLQNIPEPLMDRMEIINLSSYTELEKQKIARDYLIPKLLVLNGLTSQDVTLTDETILAIIRYYTKEAGVRQLERWMAKIMRKVVVKQLKKELLVNAITPDQLKEYLGNHLFEYTQREKHDNIGVVTGLAWTQYGGDILPIEVNYFQGKGNITLTGKLGDIMKESANIALGYIKSNAQSFGISGPDFFKNLDIHLHVPEGAVPKDGPSAGITITTCLLSSLTNRPVSHNLAMTGEITLRGNVLAIGGLKEKLISAHRSGINEVIIPADNEKDLDEVPIEVKEALKIHLVRHYSQVYKLVFGNDMQNVSPTQPNEQLTPVKVDENKENLDSTTN